MPKRQPRVGKKKITPLDMRRANDAANSVRGKRVVKGGVVKWIPTKKK